MSFWAVHGYIGGFFFILALFCMPRLAMLLLLAVAVGPVLWLTEPFGLAGQWMGIPIVIVGWALWLTFPRFLIAILATVLYGGSNIVLVALAWLSAYVFFTAKKEAAERRATERQQEAAQATAEEPRKQSRSRTSGAGQQRRRRPTQTARQRAQQWWEILGVDPNASVDAIKSAYRRIAKATHPDAAPDGKGDLDRFRKSTEAYHKGLERNGNHPSH